MAIVISRFIEGIKNLENFSDVEKDKAIALLEHREAVFTHPDFESACNQAESRYPWAYTVLIGPYYWYIDMNRSRQIRMALDEIEKYL